MTHENLFPRLSQACDYKLPWASSHHAAHFIHLWPLLCDHQPDRNCPKRSSQLVQDETVAVLLQGRCEVFRRLAF